MPGLSDIPLVGRLFAHNRRQTQETDIVLTLTPRIIRVLDLSEEDLRPFRVGGEGSGPLISLPDLPILPPPDPAQQQQQPPPPQPAPAAPQPPPPAGATPITPPRP